MSGRAKWKAVRRQTAVVVALAILLCAGCGKNHTGIKGAKLAVFPVKGKLTIDGHPMAGARLLFNPTKDFPAGSAQVRPQATVDADGTFEVSTYGKGDGAPEGEYRVSVSWKPDEGGHLSSEQRSDEDEKAPESVRRPKSSKLRAKVVQGQTELPPWNLTDVAKEASNE
jgi:hypothetical protein